MTHGNIIDLWEVFSKIVLYAKFSQNSRFLKLISTFEVKYS